MRRLTTPGRGEVGQTPGIAAVPRGRATFRGALPGVARPSGNEGAGVSPGWGRRSGGDVPGSGEKKIDFFLFFRDLTRFLD